MILELNDYEAANLGSALKAALIWQDVPDNPLRVLNSGDWIAQIYHKLPELEQRPNRTPEEYVKESLARARHILLKDKPQQAPAVDSFVTLDEACAWSETNGGAEFENADGVVLRFW